MTVFSVVLAAVLLASLAAGGLFLNWLLRPSFELEDGDADADTVWVDMREWLMLDRLFGDRPQRLTYRPDEPPPGA